jgi:hypothetical protein
MLNACSCWLVGGSGKVSSVAAQSRGRVSRLSAKTTHRRTPADRQSVLRTDCLSAGGQAASTKALSLCSSGEGVATTPSFI